MRHGLIVVAAIATTLSIAAQASAASSQSSTGGKVRVRIAGANNGKDVTNGGVAGKGRFTATGVITDRGTAVAYRTVTGSLPGGVITLRFVTVGKKGAITYVVKIDTGSGTSR
jgi:hypothetical protein